MFKLVSLKAIGHATFSGDLMCEILVPPVLEDLLNAAFPSQTRVIKAYITLKIA